MTSSMAEVIAIVTAAIDAYIRRHRELLAAVEKTRQVLARLVAVTTGSTHPAPWAARWALEQSRTELEESAANAGETVQLLTSYLASLEGSGGATGSTQTPSRTSETPATSQAANRDDSGSAATDRDRGIPKLQEKVGLSGTYAQVYTLRGKAVSNLFRAHDSAEVPDIDDIKPEHRTDTTVTWHAEAHAASFLRIREEAELEIVQTMAPCQAVNGCNANIAKVIPQDKTLHVTRLRRGGKARQYTYDGTGEWLT